MPRMPTIVTWVSTVDRLLPVTKCEKLTLDAKREAQRQHDEGNRGRIEMQETLDAPEEIEAFLLELRLGGCSRRERRLEFLRAGLFDSATLRS